MSKYEIPQLAKEVCNLIARNSMLEAELAHTPRDLSFFSLIHDIKIDSETIAAITGIHVNTIRRYFQLDKIEKHPKSNDKVYYAYLTHVLRNPLLINTKTNSKHLNLSNKKEVLKGTSKN